MKTRKYLALLLAAAMVLPATAAVCAAEADVPRPTPLFTFSEGGVAVAGADGGVYEVEGTRLTITAGGAYRITGTCGDGAIAVAPGTVGVELVLEDLTLAGEAPLTYGAGSGVVLRLGGTDFLIGREAPDAPVTASIAGEQSYVLFGAEEPAEAKPTRPPDAEIPADPYPPKPMGGGAQPQGRASRTVLDPGAPAEALAVEAGDALAVLDGGGETLAAATAAGAGRYVLFSHAGLAAGAEYVLTVNGSEAARGTAGGAAGRAARFTDVSGESWYMEAVTYVTAKGLMEGVRADLFGPDTFTTRATVWTILARLSGADVRGGSPWYEKARQWAVKADITDGAAPDRAVSREELITMLYRYGKLAYGAGFPDGAAGAYDWPYEDWGDISVWAYQPMAWMSRGGIITGKTAKRLDPQGTATRAELAVILQRYLESESARSAG